MPKCGRCPLKTECNKAPLFAKTENGNIKRVCPLIIIIGEFLEAKRKKEVIK